MNNFDYLKNYQIPGDLLLDLLDLYKIIGYTEAYNKIYKDDFLVDYNHALEEDCFAIVNYLKIKVSYERQRLIITKDYTELLNYNYVCINNENKNYFYFITNMIGLNDSENPITEITLKRDVNVKNKL